MSNEQKPAGKLAGKLAGKAAAITGGNQGIGKAIALEFAAQGANIFLMDRKAGTLPAVAADGEALGVEAGHCDMGGTQPGGGGGAEQTYQQVTGQYPYAPHLKLELRGETGEVASRVLRTGTTGV